MSAGAPKPEILYQSESLRVVANTLSSPLRFVSFSHMLYRDPPPRFWGDGFFAKYGLPAIGFVSARPDWFPAEEMRRAAAAIRAALARAPGERLVSYGVSMGGYAALKYASLLGVDAAIAFSPQISIAPADVARFDPRYLRHHDPVLHAGMQICGADLAPENHVLYDNFWTVDRKHADRLAALGPVARFPLPFTGHAPVRALAEGHIAAPFLLRLLDPAPARAADLRLMVRRTRRSTLVYWESRASTLTARRPAAARTILHAVETAQGLAPNAPIWRLALATALLNCGFSAEAERELEKIDLTARSPVDLWLRYIDCYRRIHGERATLAMMGRASAEVQSHPAFRFEEAVIRLDAGDKASAAAIVEDLWPARERITRRLRLAVLLGTLGEKEKALALFRAMAEESPNAGNLVQLAFALAEDRSGPASHDEALARLAEARTVIDPDAALWRRILLLYERLGAPAEQLAAAREAVAALPGYPDLRMELAIALERSGASAEAFAIAQRLPREPARIRRIEWLILMLRRAGREAEALALARATASERPEDLASRLQLAVLLLARDEEEEAFPHLLAVRERPGTIRADLLDEATSAFTAVGLHADAARTAGRAAVLRETELAPQLDFAARLVRAGLAPDARKFLAGVRKRLGTDPAALVAIATAYIQAGEDFRAEDLLRIVLRETGEPATARMQLIAIRARHGNWLERLSARRAAARLAASLRPDPTAWAALADLFAGLGQSARALSAIARARALAPDSPSTALREAELLLAAGKRAAARDRLTALLDRDPSPASFARAVPLLEQCGDARPAAERWLAASPQSAAARLALARALIRAGNTEAGHAHLSRLMERRTGDAALWSATAELLLDQRDWPEAKRAAERAIANDPGNAKRARDILGMAELVGTRRKDQGALPLGTPPRAEPLEPILGGGEAGQF